VNRAVDGGLVEHPGDMAIPLSLDSLDPSERFIDAAAIAFAEARTVPGVAHCTLTLHTTTGAPALTISDGPATPGEHVLSLPVVGSAGRFATLACAGHEPLTTDAERELAMVATRLSVWCTARGIAAVPVLDVKLPARQYQIAQLIGAGMTNPEIAAALGISINTVKMRLKQMFERLEIEHRDALAEVMRQFAPLAGIPLGTSQHGELTVVRSAQIAAWVV
jgi:DNA-binding CsgD family transcriptional regulator